jgi:metallo-beta-lactamase family protein
MSATLTFLGAAGTVTGSKYLLETPSARVLLDCGLFQGERELRRRNWSRFPVEPATLDAVVVTHAHLDHCGYLPVLVRNGFAGPVVCTPNTAQLAAIVLRDAAHLQEEDAGYANEQVFSKHRPALPLFGSADAEKAIGLIEPLAHEQPGALPGGITVTLRPAGHILGSSFAEVDVSGIRLLVSGDMGRPVHPLLVAPVAPGQADVMLLESTYGNRRHGVAGDGELAAAIRHTARRGGVALLPAFAVDRTPMLLRTLARLEADGAIPELPVYVDSPMAHAALDVYNDAVGTRDPEIRADAVDGDRLIMPRRFRLMRTREESQRLNDPAMPCVIISASGMATGGRVLHHLRDQLPNSRNSVVLTGFQVAGTRGRALADGVRQLKIHGRYVPVRSTVVVVDGFSAHADAAEMMAWLGDVRPPQVAYIVHGERSSAESFADRLFSERGWNTVVPTQGEKVRL